MSHQIGFMQGRLCDQVGDKIQAFPWRDWESEFHAAVGINLHVMEWTLDQERLYENPLMTVDGRERIRRLCDHYNFTIPSLTGDCFMQAPFWKTSGKERSDLQADFLSICSACFAVGIRMVVVPIVDNGRLETAAQEDVLVFFLEQQLEILAWYDLQVIFESDMAPSDLGRFITRLPAERFGINYDIGNSAALGYKPLDEFEAYGSRVLNVHVKDRNLEGASVPLNAGNADFHLVFSQLAKYGYKGNFILQTARSIYCDHTGDISKYRDMVNEWITSCFIS